jgi:hypothetical protein
MSPVLLHFLYWLLVGWSHPLVTAVLISLVSKAVGVDSMPNLKSTGLLSVVETGTMHGFRSAMVSGMVSEETGVNSLPNFKLADLFFCC